MLPAAARDDWFVIPRTWTSEIAALKKSPQIQFLSETKAAVHVSHLPLIAHRSEVSATLDAIGRPQISREADYTGLPSSTSQALEALSAAGITPRPHQLDVPRFVKKRRGALIGDMMRVGKTAASLLSHDPGRGKLIVVGPLSTREGWLKWIRSAFPQLSVFVAKGKEFDPGCVEADVVWIHYDILAAWNALGTLPIGTLIFDEAHLLSNAGARRTAAATMISTRAGKVLLLSGTPLWNKPVNLWTLCNLIAPGAFGTHGAFGGRYGAPEQTKYGIQYRGVSNGDELKARFGALQIARSWTDVIGHLPEIDRTTEIVTISDAQRDQIEKAVWSVKAAPLKGVKAFLAELGRYRKAVGKVKGQAAVEWLERVNEPTVVWAWHKDVAKLIAEGAHGYLVTGDTPPEERVQIFEEWNRDSRPLVITISVGQVGLDFSHARLALFAEVDFTPAVIGQAEMRVFSPSRPMAATYLIADHDVERTIIASLQKKLENAGKVGVASAEGAVDVIAEAFSIPRGSVEALAAQGDLDRLLGDLTR